MVHLTYNDTERRKSAIECKIRAYIPIYPEMLLQSVPNQPETVCSISRNAAEDPARTVLRYHAGIDRSSYAPYQPEPIPTAPTESARTDHAKPEQLVTASPCRIFRISPVRGVRSRFTAPLFVMPEKCFLRLSANFSAELHQITVMRNY